MAKLEEIIKINSLNEINLNSKKRIQLKGEYLILPPESILMDVYIVLNLKEEREVLIYDWEESEYLEFGLIGKSNFDLRPIYYIEELIYSDPRVAIKNVNSYVLNPTIKIENNNLYLVNVEGVKFDLDEKEYILSKDLENPEFDEEQIKQISKVLELERYIETDEVINSSRLTLDLEDDYKWFQIINLKMCQIF